jgi:hypothetical protein
MFELDAIDRQPGDGRHPGMHPDWVSSGGPAELGLPATLLPAWSGRLRSAPSWQRSRAPVDRILLQAIDLSVQSITDYSVVDTRGKVRVATLRPAPHLPTENRTSAAKAGPWPKGLRHA